MNVILLILAAVCLAMLVYITDWRAIMRHWYLLRAKQKVLRTIWLAALIAGLVLLSVGLGSI